MGEDPVGNYSDGGEVAAEALQDKQGQEATCRCAGWCRFQLAAHIPQGIPEGRCESEQEVVAALVHH